MRKLSSYLVVVTSALALVTAASIQAPLGHSAGRTSSGLRGVVRRGPTQPVCQVDNPCTSPAKNVLLRFARGGVTHLTRTDASGRYRILLVPGRYLVKIVGARLGYSPHAVLVYEGRFSVRNFEIDTGIR